MLLLLLLALSARGGVRAYNNTHIFSKDAEGGERQGEEKEGHFSGSKGQLLLLNFPTNIAGVLTRWYPGICTSDSPPPHGKVKR